MQDEGQVRRSITVGDQSVAYVERGGGPTVVLIHGALVNSDDMRLSLLGPFGERFRTVAFDRPGHGLSTRTSFADASVWRQAEILHDAASALGLNKPYLVGHSFGGAVALAWAMAFPEDVAGVLALAPICFPELRLEHLLFGPRAMPLAGPAMARVLNASSDPILLSALWRAMFLPQTMPESFSRHFSFDLAGASEQTVRGGEDASMLMADLALCALRYREAATPTCILGGNADLVVNNDLHGRQAALLMPNAAFTALPGVGHMLHHVRTDEVVEAMRSLMEHRPAGGFDEPSALSSRYAPE